MNEKMNVDKKFYAVGLVIGALALVGSLIFPLAGLLLGIIGLVLNIKNKNNYSVKIGIALSIAGIVLSILFIGFIVWTQIIIKP